MKLPALAAALLLGAFPAVLAAQPADIPRHQCQQKPKLPGPSMRQDKMVERQFKRDLEAYTNCIKAYANERSAAAKAHTEAGNAAIEEYNATMKALQDEQSNK